MKKAILAWFLFCVVWLVTTQSSTMLTVGQVEALAKAKWGVDARISQTGTPGATGWRWTYQVGFQDYYPAMVATPFNGIPNPYSGKPKPIPTWIGSGSSWQKAWESVPK